MELGALLAGWDRPDDYRAFVETNLAGVSGGVAWAIAAALAEQDDQEIAQWANIERTVALLMTDIAPSTLAATVERWLAFPSGEARRAARRRARVRLCEHPELGTVARRAVELAAAGTDVSRGAWHLPTGRAVP